jgi:hypothetical protein
MGGWTDIHDAGKWSYGMVSLVYVLSLGMLGDWSLAKRYASSKKGPMPRRSA